MEYPLFAALLHLSFHCTYCCYLACLIPCITEYSPMLKYTYEKIWPRDSTGPKPNLPQLRRAGVSQFRICNSNSHHIWFLLIPQLSISQVNWRNGEIGSDILHVTGLGRH